MIKVVFGKLDTYRTQVNLVSFMADIFARQTQPLYAFGEQTTVRSFRCFALVNDDPMHS